MTVSGATFWLNRRKLKQGDQSRARRCVTKGNPMKTKTWTVMANTGKHADLESGLEKKEVQKPSHISTREFVHWLAAASHIDDDSLRSLFKL
jgi:hypothetical protein